MGLLWILIPLGFVLVQVTCVPEIQNKPITVNLYEEEKSQKKLTDITCIPSTDIRVSVVSVFPPSPCGACFAIYQTGSSPFQLFYLPSKGNLSSEVAGVYKILVNCTDLTDFDTAIVEVRLRTNEPPYFSSLTASKSIDATTLKRGETVFNVDDATDPDNDPIYYNLTVLPASSAYKYDIALTTGLIRATADLETECFPSLVLFVYIHDPRNAIIGPKVITVHFTNYHKVPYIPGLNKPLSVSEDLAVGETVGPSDIKAETDTFEVTYPFETYPQSAAYFFEIKTGLTPHIELRNKLNWESAFREINITIKPTNEFCVPDVFFLYVKVVDSNDPPVLTPVEDITWQQEGKVSYNPGFLVIDEDQFDTYSLKIASGNDDSLFRIDYENGIITSENYDIDKGANSDRVELVVEAIDSKGPATATATVIINFLDANDNAPRFTQGSYIRPVQDCTPLGYVVATVAVSDDVDSDYNNNNVVECIKDSNGFLQVLTSCEVILQSSIPADGLSTIYVRATDLGNPPKETAYSVPVTAVSSACQTSTTPPTQPPPPTTVLTTTFISTTTVVPTLAGVDALLPDDAVNGSGSLATSNIAWIIVACVLGCIAVACGALVFTRYCLPNCTGQSNGTGSVPNNTIEPKRRAFQQQHFQQYNQDQRMSTQQKNAQNPVTPREVKPYEPKGAEAYRKNDGIQQKNVWHGMSQQPGKAFDI